MSKKQKSWDSLEVADLFQAVLQLETVQEAKQFFRDLMTEQELIEFGKRWKVARMLSDGVSYNKIIKKTGMSSTTVARIAKWLNNGMSGYKLMLEKTHHNTAQYSTRLRET